MTEEQIKEKIRKGVKRKCNKCGKMLPVTDFFIKKDKDNKHWRFNSPCKKCGYAYTKTHRRAYQRDYHLKRNFALPLEEYEQKMSEQNHACVICGIQQKDAPKAFAVDHDHSTGNIRALLCINCNSGLGFFKDSIHNLEKAIEYLEHHNTTKFPTTKGNGRKAQLF